MLLKIEDLVVHCKKDKFDVYIGRPSKWGNPFAMSGESDRLDVIRKYHQWLNYNFDCHHKFGETLQRCYDCGSHRVRFIVI